MNPSPSPFGSVPSEAAAPNRWIRYGLVIGFIPLLGLGLGLDSLKLAERGTDFQGLADGISIIYFGLMLWGLRKEEQQIALIFVPFSALAEYLFSQVFDFYRYRLDAVPLYVPFGHAILFCTGLVLADLRVLKDRASLKYGLIGFHFSLFLIAITLWHDELSAVLLLVFAWVLRRKGPQLLYGIMGCLVLMVELGGTTLGCWTWQPEIGLGIHTTNPPVGAFVFYVLGDLGGFKIARSIPWSAWGGMLKERSLFSRS